MEMLYALGLFGLDLPAAHVHDEFVESWVLFRVNLPCKGPSASDVGDGEASLLLAGAADPGRDGGNAGTSCIPKDDEIFHGLSLNIFLRKH